MDYDLYSFAYNPEDGTYELRPGMAEKVEEGFVPLPGEGTLVFKSEGERSDYIRANVPDEVMVVDLGLLSTARTPEDLARIYGQLAEHYLSLQSKIIDTIRVRDNV